MSKVVMKFHFPKSDVEKVNVKLLSKYRKLMQKFLMHLRQLQPNRRGVMVNNQFKEFYGYEIESPKMYNYYIVNEKPYASYFETGTGIYGPKGEMIVPKYMKAYGNIIRLPYALHWEKAGTHFFAKKVRGMKPTKPFTSTLYNDFKKIMREVMVSDSQ